MPCWSLLGPDPECSVSIVPQIDAVPARPYNSVDHNKLMMSYAYCLGIWSPIQSALSLHLGPGAKTELIFQIESNSLL